MSVRKSDRISRHQHTRRHPRKDGFSLGCWRVGQVAKNPREEVSVSVGVVECELYCTLPTVCVAWPNFLSLELGIKFQAEVLLFMGRGKPVHQKPASFLYNTGMWQTDRQTDRHTGSWTVSQVVVQCCRFSNDIVVLMARAVFFSERGQTCMQRRSAVFENTFF